MNIPITDEIRHHLHTFDVAVRETREHLTELDSLGRYRASAPYIEKYCLIDLLASHDPDETFRATVTREFEKIAGDLSALERLGGKKYRDQLFADLCVYTECYYAALCYSECRICDMDADRDLFMRDTIAALQRELQNDYDLVAIGQKVAALDDAVQRMVAGTRDPKPDTAKPGKICTASGRITGTYSGDMQEKERVSSR